MLMAANDGRAQGAAGESPLENPNCRPPAATSTRHAADSEAKVCSNTGNDVSAVFNTPTRHTGLTNTGVNTREGRGDGTGPDGTADGANDKPQRKTILSRSWRQIFPRAN